MPSEHSLGLTKRGRKLLIAFHFIINTVLNKPLATIPCQTRAVIQSLWKSEQLVQTCQIRAVVAAFAHVSLVVNRAQAYIWGGPAGSPCSSIRDYIMLNKKQQLLQRRLL